MRAISLSLLAVVAMLALSACGGDQGSGASREKPSCQDTLVTPASWLAAAAINDPEDPRSRRAIADRLVSCQILLKKSHNDVKKMLGTPDEGGARSKEMNYSLGGDGSSMDSDPAWLMVVFDHGRVTSATAAG